MLCTCWSLTKSSSKQLVICATLQKRKVPWLILWKPLCLCPCAKQLQLLPLARILAKYWRLLVESRPVKTIWEETSFSGDDNRAKQNHRQCGGIRTQPNLPASREQRQHQKEEGRLSQIVSKKRRGQKKAARTGTLRFVQHWLLDMRRCVVPFRFPLLICPILLIFVC